MQLALIPIAPLLLLPFLLVLFVVLFPLWLAAIAVLGVVYGVVWVVERALGLAGVAPGWGTRPVWRALDWVLTFGGFTRARQE